MADPRPIGVLDRRTFLRGVVAAGASVALGAQLAACATPGSQARPTAAPATPGQSPTDPPASLATLPSGQPEQGTRKRVLLAYFSRAGENYFYGDTTMLDVGNTQVVAEMITARIACDVYRIEAADPYPVDYEATVERNVQEQRTEARPAIASPLPGLDDYDTVLLGSGIWNVQPPMIMRTFVEGVDLAGRTIHPFVTHAGSGLGRAIDDYTRLCPGATVGDGLAVRGEEARDAQDAVDGWLREIGLLAA